MQFDPPFVAEPPGATPLPLLGMHVPPRDQWPTFLPLPERKLERTGHSDAVWLELEYGAARYWAEQDAKAGIASPARGQRTARNVVDRAEKNRQYQQQFRDRKKAPNAVAAQRLLELQQAEEQKVTLRAQLEALDALILTARAAWRVACLAGPDDTANAAPAAP